MQTVDKRRAWLVKYLGRRKAGDMGFFYLMRWDDGVYKIGRTQNLKERMRDHRRAYTSSFELIFSIWTVKYDALENGIRKLFANKRTSYGIDFFKFDADDVAFITSLTPDFVSGIAAVIPLLHGADDDLIDWFYELPESERLAVCKQVLRRALRSSKGVRRGVRRGV